MAQPLVWQDWAHYSELAEVNAQKQRAEADKRRQAAGVKHRRH